VSGKKARQVTQGAETRTIPCLWICLHHQWWKLLQRQAEDRLTVQAAAVRAGGERAGEGGGRGGKEAARVVLHPAGTAPQTQGRT
jgi:hypothetical protein